MLPLLAALFALVAPPAAAALALALALAPLFALVAPLAALALALALLPFLLALALALLLLPFLVALFAAAAALATSAFEAATTVGSAAKRAAAILTPCWSTLVAAWFPAMAAGRSFWSCWTWDSMAAKLAAMVMLEGGLSPASGVTSVCWTATQPPKSWAFLQRMVQTLPADANGNCQLLWLKLSSTLVFLEYSHPEQARFFGMVMDKVVVVPASASFTVKAVCPVASVLPWGSRSQV